VVPTASAISRCANPFLAQQQGAALLLAQGGEGRAHGGALVAGLGGGVRVARGVAHRSAVGRGGEQALPAAAGPTGLAHHVGGDREEPRARLGGVGRRAGDQAHERLLGGVGRRVPVAVRRVR
jgi:hypothetical protein